MLLLLTDWETSHHDNTFGDPEHGRVMVNTDDIAEIRPSGNNPPASRITFKDRFRPHINVTETMEQIYGQQATLAGVTL
jgi:hypothetical protein